MDGPYGVHDFNYRRYPVLVLVGGGVGITPVMSMLKDIYNHGDYSENEMLNQRPHCMSVVHAVWVMRYGLATVMIPRWLRNPQAHT